MPLEPMLVALVFSRAAFHYSLGIRGFFFSVPLVAWLFGSAALVGMTVLYLIGSYFAEEVMDVDAQAAD